MSSSLPLVLSVLIVNWNSGLLLARCVESVHRALSPQLAGRYELVIVDNGSRDDSIARAKLAHGETLLSNAHNAGFGAACNQAAARAGGEFLLLLNPDCELRPGSVERCLAELRREDLPVGICGVALEDETGRVAQTCHRFPGFGALLGSAVGLNAIWPRLADSRMIEWDHRSDRTVDHVIGAFYLIRAATFEALGGFDERFFVYLEDLDLSLRARRQGLITRFVAAPPSFHLGGGVSRQVKAERLFYATRSRMLYGFKHLPAWQAWIHAAATLGCEPWARTVQALLRRSWQDLRFTWRGFALVYRDLPTLWRAQPWR
jgi:GT2 family glycosyltransferase